MSSKNKFSLSGLSALPSLGLGDYFATTGSDSDSNDDEDIEQLGLIVQQITAMKATKERQQRLQTTRANIESLETSVVSAYEKRLTSSKNKLKTQEEALKKAWTELRALDRKHAERNQAIMTSHNKLKSEVAALTRLSDAIDREFEGAINSAAKDLSDKCAEKLRELREMAANVHAEE